MKKTNIVLISIILFTSSFIFAQNDDYDEFKVVDSYSFNTRQYKDLDVSISYGLGELIIGSSDEKC